MTSDIHSTAPLKPTENGIPPLTRITGNSAMETSGMYSASMMGSTDIKSPQLPFGENVSVAAGIIGAQ
jgi:poly(A) polymerase